MALDKLVDRHKNPWTQLFHLLGFISIGYGLWTHEWICIVIGVVFLVVAHLFPCCKTKKKTKKK